MELNREELGILIRAINEKLENFGDGVRLVDGEKEFNEMISAQTKLRNMQTRLQNEIQKINDSYEDENSMFGAE